MITKKNKKVKSDKAELSWITGAGIVGADIGTSVLYGTGILFPIVGYYAPFFVLAVCLMMWAFKQTYEEGLFLSPVNGGAYSMILKSLGRRTALIAGALTSVTYLATAAVSALSGSFYLSSLFETPLPTHWILLLSFIPIIFFAILNTKGIKEPAKLVTVIAGFHFLLLLVISIIGTVYLFRNWGAVDFQAILANPIPLNDHGLTFATVIYGFAAAFLGVTGFESAAQIIEELEAPSLKTLRRLYRTVIICVSITAPVVSAICLLVLTKDEVTLNLNALLSALGQKMGGRILLTVIVIDATLTLYAAVNTAFVGFTGLAKTMAKQGNLPGILLKRIAHNYPSVEGYPLIAAPFALVTILIIMLMSGKVDDLAKMYEIAFLGVMVSFGVGTILLRRKSNKDSLPGAKEYLSETVIRFKGKDIGLIPLLSSIVLAICCVALILHASTQALLISVTLFFITLLIMAFYRWGVLESRLASHTDLRLGLGKFTTMENIPHNVPVYLLYTGGVRISYIVYKAIQHIIKQESINEFELFLFHSEENDGDSHGFIFEQIQRVISQNIAPIYTNKDMIITVKILPGSLIEGLHTLKKTHQFKSFMFSVADLSQVNPNFNKDDFIKNLNTEIELDLKDCVFLK